MKSFSLYFILICFIAISSWSCDDCRLIDCQGASESIQIRFVRNGENALYGPNAVAHPDSLRYYFIADFGPYEKYYSKLIDSTFAIGVQHQQEYYLEIPGVRTDVYEAQFTKIAEGECCDAYLLLEVRRNGTLLCVNGCEDVIEIEI